MHTTWVIMYVLLLLLRLWNRRIAQKLLLQRSARKKFDWMNSNEKWIGVYLKPCLSGWLVDCSILACVMSSNNLIYDPMRQKRMTRCSFCQFVQLLLAFDRQNASIYLLIFCLSAPSSYTYVQAMAMNLSLWFRIYWLKESSQRWQEFDTLLLY